MQNHPPAFVKKIYDHFLKLDPKCTSRAEVKMWELLNNEEKRGYQSYPSYYEVTDLYNKTVEFLGQRIEDISSDQPGEVSEGVLHPCKFSISSESREGRFFRENCEAIFNKLYDDLPKELQAGVHLSFHEYQVHSDFVTTYTIKITRVAQEKIGVDELGPEEQVPLEDEFFDENGQNIERWSFWSFLPGSCGVPGQDYRKID